MVNEIFKYWPGQIKLSQSRSTFHEAQFLSLNIEKVQKVINWSPVWDFSTTIQKTVSWYKEVYEGKDPYIKCLENIKDFIDDSDIL